MAVRIMVGDARERLRELPDGSVHCVVTSPPYWALRAYKGDPGMIGLEPTFDEHLANLVAVFREVRRVLRDDGTCWMNYGDAYAGGGRGLGSGKQLTNKGAAFQPPFHPDGFKPKDLMLMPARVAMALQSDGWWLRSEVVWHKRNPMPESVTDRPTNAHEKLFLMSKSPRYYYDAEAVRTASTGPARDAEAARKARARADNKSMPDSQRNGMRHAGFNERRSKRAQPPRHECHGPMHGGLDDAPRGHGANLRNVWSIATAPYSEAHFATFPPALVEPCVKAGTSERGACAECGAPWSCIGTVNCSCNAGTVPCTVLDPFGGAGTVGLVADRLRRDAILIEINADYAEMARNRIRDDAPLLADVATE